MQRVVIILLASLLGFTSCSKKEDKSEAPNPSFNQSTATTDGHKGKYSMVFEGQTFSHLRGDIILTNHTLEIPGESDSGTGFQFVGSSTVGEVGETRQICLDDETCPIFISSQLMGEGNINFTATSGTIQRVSKYVVEYNLVQDFGAGQVKTLVATVTIGIIVAI